MKFSALYIFEHPEEIPDAYLKRLLNRLPDHRLKKAMAMKTPGGQRQSAVAWTLLEHALYSEDLPVHRPVFYRWDVKPQFEDLKMPRFSLSHCKEAVAVALNWGLIGVDVEGYDSYSADVAKATMNKDELAFINGDPARFAMLWTRKESLFKFHGVWPDDNVADMLHSEYASHVCFQTFTTPRRYACTVCTFTPMLERLTPNFVTFTDLI